MAVAFVTSAASSVSSSTSATVTIDATGGDMLVAFLVGGWSSAPTGFSASYNSAALTGVAGMTPFKGANSSYVVALSLANPTTGSHTLSASWTTSAIDVFLVAMVFSGASGIVTGIQTGASSSSLTVASDSSSIVAGAWTNQSVTADSVTGGTTDFSTTTPGFFGYGAGHITGSSSTSFATGNTEDAIAAFSVNGGVINSQTATVSCSTALLAEKSAATTLPISCATAVANAILTNKIALVVCAGAVAAVKAIATTLTVACDGAIAAVKSATRSLAMSSTTSTSAMPVKASVLVLAVACSTSVVRAIRVAKIIAVSCTTTFPITLVYGVLNKIRRASPSLQKLRTQPPSLTE